MNEFAPVLAQVGGTGIVEYLTVFVLAAFVGIEVVSKVPSILHTPLMSGSNAIHGIVLVGALTIMGEAHGTAQLILGFLAVFLATLNVVGGFNHLKPFVAELGRAGVRVSLFIEPSIEALDAAAALRAPVVELHTGAWCDALAREERERADHEFGRLRVAAAQCASLGLECHAGHGLDYDTARTISALPQIVELNIGHVLVGEAIFVGLAESVRQMRAAMAEGRSRAK